MKLFLLAASLLPFCTRAQSTEPWTQFSMQARGEYRYGYRDASGRVRIPAKFGNFTNARTFRHIMAVSESKSYQRILPA